MKDIIPIYWILMFLSVLSILSTGCEEERASYFNRWERYGKVYYLDGAGNLGFGQETVPRALRAAGWRGDFESIIWTSFTGPLGDQLIRINAKLKAEDLTKKIVSYRKRHPDAPIFIIALSAGTGVATWAVENLPDDLMVDTMVFLGSSLASNYNMTRCLRHVKNKIYVFYSDRDAILTSFIPVTGTIDGSYFIQPAGIVGFKAPNDLSPEDRRLYDEKIVNIPWRPEFERYGYAGGHTDGTNYEFVRYFIAPKLLNISLHSSSDKIKPEDNPENNNDDDNNNSKNNANTDTI